MAPAEEEDPKSTPTEVVLTPPQSQKHDGGNLDGLIGTVRTLVQRTAALEIAEVSARARDDKTEAEIKEINDNMKGIAKEFRDGLKSIDDKLGNLISIRSLFFGSLAVCASAIVSSIVVFVQRLWYG